MVWVDGVGIALVLVAMLGDRLELVDANGCSSWEPWKVGSTQVGNILRGDMAVDACTCCCSLYDCRLLVGVYCSRSKSMANSTPTKELPRCDLLHVWNFRTNDFTVD